MLVYSLRLVERHFKETYICQWFLDRDHESKDKCLNKLIQDLLHSYRRGMAFVKVFAQIC